MDVHASNLDYYDKMQQLEERLKRSEEERMLLQRQYDLLVQSNHDKERARVSVIEARYKRFLDEDKRRRDRNSSLLQALDRIDSHTASLAAKTERMRSLRKHYEAFIAHSYPGWQLEMERPYCPLAAIAPPPPRITDVTDYNADNPRFYPDASEYSDTQYHALPGITPKPSSSLGTPLCRSELSLSSRDDFPTVGRSLYRTGSAATRSASLSPSRVRDLSSQYDAKKINSSSVGNYDLYYPSKSSDLGLSPRPKSESNFSKISDGFSSLRQPSYHSNLKIYGEEKPIAHKPLSSTNNHFLEYDHGTSETDLNTSGDLLNLSNLSLSDDGILNELEIHDTSAQYSPVNPPYTSPREFGSAKRIPSISLSIPSASVRYNVSPRETYVPKRSASLSPSLFISPSPKSILSPRSRTSDNVHRILLPSELDLSRAEASLSPRRHKPTWQTLRPSYIPPPARSTIRRSVTFSEPEYETPYSLRDEDGSMYSGSYGSLRRHSPSLPVSSWESSDHERFLRDKQGREKDAFREKIERLKELIRENKDQEIGFTSPMLDATAKSSFQPKVREYEKEKLLSQENDNDRDWKVSQSRRSSFARETASDDEENDAPLFKNIDETDKLYNGDKVLIPKTDSKNAEDVSQAISNKEQRSGQLNEKDEDVKENMKTSENEEKNQITPQQHLVENKQYFEDNNYTNMPYELTKEEHSEKTKSNEESLGDHAQSNGKNDMGSENILNGTEVKNIQEPGKESSDFIYAESQPQYQNQNSKVEEGEQRLELDHDSTTDHSQEVDKAEKSYQNNSVIQEGQEGFSEYSNNYNYAEDPKQQEWTAHEDDGSKGQQNLQYNYEQSDQTPTGYENQSQISPSVKQESGFEAYQTDGDQAQQNYENYQSDTNQQSQLQENYGENAGYEQYQDPKQATDSTSGYQEYSEDPAQYQQNYQTYSEDQQYSKQEDPAYSTQDQAYDTQDPAYNTQDPNSYQYSQDPNKAQYEYENQEYNYQQNPESYDYSQDPNYQQGQAYQQEQPYQADQSYSQDPNYPQDPQYQQGSEYQQDQQYQEAGYDGSAQYPGYQPGAEDLSEDTTTPSADSNYAGQIQGSEATDQSQTLEQYRALLGADPNSEQAYSDSSEIENQMAAVVGLGTNASVPEQIPATTPSVAPAMGKGKAATKKKPQLTRKQSSITADSVEGNEQRPKPLTKTPEEKSDPAAPQLSDSDFDTSSH